MNENEFLVVRGLADTYSVEMRPYSGVDFSRLAFMFCGQGQSKAGLMREEASTHEIFKVRLRQLDDLSGAAGLGRASDFVMGSNYARERHGIYSSLNLYCLQVAMFETLLTVGIQPSVLTAHSFGEFAMLTAAGVVGFQPMVKFLIERHQALVKESEGRFTMLAIGDAGRLAGLQTEVEYRLANINTPQQVALVCRERDAAVLRSALKRQRIASVNLEIEFPFHTEWLESARTRLAGRLEALDLKISPPTVPFVSSVSRERIERSGFSEAKIASIMTDQLTTQVDFPAQIEQIYAGGAGHFIEISPVDILVPFVEQVLRAGSRRFKTDSFRRKSVGRARQNSKSRPISSKFGSVLNSALKSLTGYVLEDVRLEDRIREDLGIDSIKKAEIIFQVVDSLKRDGEDSGAPVNLADLVSFADIVEYLESRAGAKAESVAVVTKSGRFELMRPIWRAQDLPDYSSGPQGPLHRIQISSLLHEPGLKLPLEKTPLLVLQDDTESGETLTRAKHLLEFFKRNKIESSRVLLVHRGGLFAETLNALLLSLSQEKQISYKSIQIQNGHDLSDAELDHESLDFYHGRVRYDSAGRRFVRDFEALGEAQSGGEIKRLLVFGGLGGIGQEFLRAMSDVETAVVVGRKVATDETQNRLRSLLPKTQTHYIAADLSTPRGCENLLDKVIRDHGPFDLAVHCVGLEHSEILERTTTAQIGEILDAKMVLADALRERSQRTPAMRVLFTGSVVGEFGNAGQAAYGLANAYLSAIAEDNPGILSVSWPAWRNTGIAADSLGRLSISLGGMPVLEKERGRELLSQVLNQDSGRFCVLCPEFLDDYAGIGQSRSELGGVFKLASSDRRLYALPGLTQRHLPYLTDHLVKKMCPLPASGSIAMMLFRGYLERGRLGSVRNFKALNFPIVHPDHSPYLLEAIPQADQHIRFQIKSSLVVAEGDIGFAPPRTKARRHSFTADHQLFLESTQNAPVYIGPKFDIYSGYFVDSRTGQFAARLNLSQTPTYTGIPILDKLHKLLELSFSAGVGKLLWQYTAASIPKSADSIVVYAENLRGTRFLSLCDQVRFDGETPIAEKVVVVNDRGEEALVIENFRMVHLNKTDPTPSIWVKLERTKASSESPRQVQP